MKKKDLEEIGQLIDQKLEPVNQKLDSLTLDMVDVQNKTNVLKDIQSYMEDTKEKVDNHKHWIQNLENAA